jgi:hypothetical protein
VPSAYTDELVAVAVGSGVAVAVGSAVAVCVGVDVVVCVEVAVAVAVEPASVAVDVASLGVALAVAAGVVFAVEAAVLPASASAVPVLVNVLPMTGELGTWNATTRADPAPVSASAMSGLAFLLRIAVNLLELSSSEGG